MEYYSAIKNNKIMPFAETWMDLEILIQVKLMKGKHHMMSLVCGVWREDASKLVCRTETDSEKLMLAKGDKWEIGMDWGFGIGICTLRCVEWSASENLLYSTGHLAQYSVITYKGKESEREWMCVHVSLNHFVQQKWSQPCKSTILQ